MEPKFRTSFVPKQPVDVTGRNTVRRKPYGLAFILTLVLFLASVALSIGVFAFQEYTERSIAKKGQELELARTQFEPALIQELVRLDTKLETAEELVGGHVALSELFAFLENNTLQSVQFESFDYTVLPDDKLALTMQGRAESFSSVALQSDIFGESQFIRSPIFENLNADINGDVTFSVNAFVDLDLLLYGTISGDVLDTATDELEEFLEEVEEDTAIDDVVEEDFLEGTATEEEFFEELQKRIEP